MLQPNYQEKKQHKGYRNYYGIPWTIIRPSAVFGPTDMNNRVSQLIVDKALRNETMIFMGKKN